MEIEKERIVEKEEAMLEGMNIGGRWNRMYEPRVITDFTKELK